MHRKSKIYYTAALLLSLIGVGTFGFYFLENMSFTDALYMTIITMSTVGYREVADLSAPGKIFTIFFILASLGMVAYAFTKIGVKPLPLGMGI